MEDKHIEAGLVKDCLEATAPGGEGFTPAVWATNIIEGDFPTAIKVGALGALFTGSCSVIPKERMDMGLFMLQMINTLKQRKQESDMGLGDL